MLDQILHWDENWFRLINGQWHQPFWDAVLPWWRDKKTWIPLYLLLAFFSIYRFKLNGIYLLLVLIITVGLADTASSQWLKKSVQRARPCHNTALEADIRILTGCSPSYSFTSSHATNHFAIAVFLFLTLGKSWRWLRWPLLLWAASIAYAQVYVGAHYPLDVIGGALLGAFIGWAMAQGYLKWIPHNFSPT